MNRVNGPALAPDPVRRVGHLLSRFPGRWAVCGGHAVDAWVGRATREHHDVDVAVFREDQRTLFDLLAGWHIVGHDDSVDDDSTEPWNGRRLDLPAHVHARSEDGLEAEFHLNERDGEEWTLRRRPPLALPLADSIVPSRWGVPVVTKAVALYWKALPPMWRGAPVPPPREQDEADLRALLPLLSVADRTWLRGAVSALAPAHGWLAALSA